MHNVGGLFITSAIILVVTLLISLFKRTKYYEKVKTHKILLQIIIGLVFAGLTFLATYLAWPEQGNANVRDAAPLIAGLVFGPIAGLVSGTIGCILRFLYTFVFMLQGEVTVKVGAVAAACALGTFLAGLFSSGAYLFILKKGQKTNILQGLAFGSLTEVFHMLMIFITFLIAQDLDPDLNSADAIHVINKAMPLMVAFNGITVPLAILIDDLINDREQLDIKKKFSLNTKVVLRMFIIVVLAFGVGLLITLGIISNIRDSYGEPLGDETVGQLMLVSGLVEGTVLTVMFAAISFILNKNVIAKVNIIKDALNDISQGHLQTRVDEHSCAEFEKLSDDINKTVDVMENFIHEAEERNSADLAMAREIQIGVLPHSFPNSERLEVFASMDPAKEVGGDFYDFFYINPYTFCFVIADVSGKGIPAAMFMMRAKSIIKSLAEKGLPANEVLENANLALCEGNDAQMFVTVYISIVDLYTGHTTTSNAGHDFPLVHGKKGNYFLETKKSFVLGGMDMAKYRIHEFDLEPGDLMYLYTDGVPEAQNSNGEFYGLNRLSAAFELASDLSVQELCESIKNDVNSFVGDADPFDDMTMIAFRYFGKRVVEKLTVKATMDAHDQVIEYVKGFMKMMDVKFQHKMEICIDEIFTNIVSYGFKGREPGQVEVVVNRSPKSITVVFIDNGDPFNPLENADPDVTLSADERGIGGLGIFIVKQVMDEVGYDRVKDKNILRIRKKVNSY